MIELIQPPAEIAGRQRLIVEVNVGRQSCLPSLRIFDTLIIMKIGLVGYQRSGKSTLFEWLTGVPADPALAHTTQAAAALVHDVRVPQLCAIYHPKKVTEASLEFVDTPGLHRDHEGSASRLAQIREAGCLIQVIEAFEGTGQVAEDLRNLQEDFLLADMEIVSNRLERLREAVKKPRPNRDEQLSELACLEPMLAHLETGQPVSEMSLSKEAEHFTRSFGLLSQKPRMAIFNLGDDAADRETLEKLSNDDCPVAAVPIGLEVELLKMEPAERDAFRTELGVAAIDRDAVMQKIMAASGQMLFFTAGEKEVRTWLIPRGATAVAAAECIHSDLARGFIRAETMTCDDLVRLGSEREVKAHHLMRQEPKDYVVQDGDILNIKFSV